MTEINLKERTIGAFSKFNDIEVVVEPSMRNYNWGAANTLRPDIVIEYGHLPFAIIELALNFDFSKDNICRQFKCYQEESSITCYIAQICDTFFYYNGIENQLFELSFEEVLKKLMCALQDSERNADDLKESLEKKIYSIQNKNFSCYKETFLGHLKKNSLMRHGNILFLSREAEIDLMCSILQNEARNHTRKEDSLCRYTSAKGFFLSSKSKSFRLNSVDTMNDVYETKVIDGFKRLKSTKFSVNEALYNGYIMCFSDISREDKLFNWYMYGSQGEGVCFTINRRNLIPKDYYYIFAPVVYVHANGNIIENDLLEFLNEIMDMQVNKETFRFRFWHFWKYFFKLDFYEEEMETRLVCITDEKANSDWNSYYNVPYKYIERKIDDLPFDIVKLTFGPKCCDSDIMKDSFSQQLGEIQIRKSSINGFRG